MASAIPSNGSTALVVYDPKHHSSIQEKPLKQMMTNIFRECSFRAQCADYQHFNRCWMGNIVVLVGTSTAGKSSIINALRRLESNRKEDGGDLRGLTFDYKNIKKRFPAEVEILEKVIKDPLDISKAIFSPERPWKRINSPPGKKEMEAEKIIQVIKKSVETESLTKDLQQIIKHCPKELEILKKVIQDPLNIPKAIFSAERTWMPGITLQAEREAESAIKRIRKILNSPVVQGEVTQENQTLELEMFDDAFAHSRRGGNIIFDVLNIDLFARHSLMRNFKGPTGVVLTYCPFKVLSSRMEKRNKEAVESGELSNKRVGEFPLDQFSEIYTQKAQGQPTFEKITRAQATSAFDGNFDKGINARRLEGKKFSEKQVLEDKEKYRNQFLERLGFKEGINEVKISPRSQELYNLFINSSKLSPADSARLIQMMLKML